MNNLPGNRRNLNTNTNTNTNTSNSKSYHFLWWFLGIVLTVILIYIIVMTTKYIITNCHRKIGYFKYLRSFRWNCVCYDDIKHRPEEKTPEPEHKEETGFLDTVADYIDTDLENKEVFHISNQDYTFNQAKCKCESYGSRLATYEELVNAYNNGANWCSYGWSEGQTAYYPTQKCTWDKKTCGKPGVNGGFFSNPYLKFGANCYGKKPKGEVAKIKHPKCSFKNFCSLSKNYAASRKLPTDKITPFNKDRWNE